MKANRLLAFGLRPQQAEADAHIILQNAEKKQKELNELQMERREGDQGKGAKNGNSETENTENASFSNMNNSDTNQNPSLSKLKGLVKSVTRDVTERDSKPSPLIFATLAATSSPQIITGILSATG
ncbi:hypothetical protein HK097_007804 [Rhizophlyctis rosea]|uniref:Uncharacterized protein n=1 Tax=Rhizophlyctis rosea TaxID=64517 RepID=A0AAD5SK96_9FUNG|nr:hypothetical protein HK097_007804 [Rhizophlyctis rosea]